MRTPRPNGGAHHHEVQTQSEIEGEGKESLRPEQRMDLQNDPMHQRRSRGDIKDMGSLEKERKTEKGGGATGKSTGRSGNK